jgi:hypothetical protein
MNQVHLLPPRSTTWAPPCHQGQQNHSDRRSITPVPQQQVLIQGGLPINEALRKTLKQLHLSGLLENLESCLQEAASHGLDHAEFLELSVQDELAVRGNRKLESPRRSGECLFEVVMRQYETWSTMMTSNRPLEDWDKLLGDAPGASAILDRFLHHAELV